MCLQNSSSLFAFFNKQMGLVGPSINSKLARICLNLDLIWIVQKVKLRPKLESKTLNGSTRTFRLGPFRLEPNQIRFN